MKIISPAIIMTLFISTSVFADLSARGPYLGAQVGYVNPDTSHEGDNWTAIRPFLGYRFNDNFAIEAGYEMFTDEIKGYDLIGKAILPFPHNFSLFIAAGGTYIDQDIQDGTYENDVNQLAPIIGIGAGYNFTKHIAADLSWLHVVHIKNVESINFIGLGLSFTF